MKHIILAASLLLAGCADRTTTKGHEMQCFRLTPRITPTVYRCINEEVLCYVYEGDGMQCTFHFGLLPQGD